MLPRPYASQAPRHGLPAFMLPVFMSMIAGSWLMASVLVDLINVRSSTIRAVYGSKSLIQVPVWPRRLKGQCEGATGKRACPAVIPVNCWLPRTEEIGRASCRERVVMWGRGG